MILRMKKRFTHPGETIVSKTTSICFTADSSVNVHNRKTRRIVGRTQMTQLISSSVDSEQDEDVISSNIHDCRPVRQKIGVFSLEKGNQLWLDTGLTQAKGSLIIDILASSARSR
jgi:hypothetical protein